MNYVGIDGCSKGWVAVSVDEEDEIKMKLFELESIRNIIESFGQGYYLIDIPVGLPDSQKTIRLCDIEARRLLGFPRSSSIFNPPTWEILEIENYKEANLKYFNITGKGLQKQSFFIKNKVKSVNFFLRDNLEYRGILKEFHPELSFYFLNGEKPLIYSKRTLEGRNERIKILAVYLNGIKEGLENIFFSMNKREVKEDDIIDACCGAILARLAKGRYKKIPAEIEVDRCGLKMEINYF